MENLGCKNNYSDTEIEKYFGESEEAMELCNSCPYLSYRNGLIICKKPKEEHTK